MLPLRIQGDGIEISDVTALGEALKVNKTVTCLRLEKNQISDVTALGEALKVNKTVMYLHLAGNQACWLILVRNASCNKPGLVVWNSKSRVTC